MKYLATKDNIAESVLRLRSGLLDFQDFGLAIHCPRCREAAFGWIALQRRLPDAEADRLGLVPAE